MRVITGTARGRRLTTLEGEDVRPTTDRVKEALFSMIQFQIEGRRILDLFAGSGQLGLETLSRDALCCTFVDSSAQAIEVMKKNLQETGLMKPARVVHMDALSFLSQCRERFDIVLLDPPYGRGLLQAVLPLLPEKMNPGGTIICESAAGEKLPEEAGDFFIEKNRRYGKIQLTLYSHRDVIMGE